MQAGVTTVNEIYHYVLSVAKAVDEVGLRAVISQNIVDVDIGALRYNDYTRYPAKGEAFVEDNIRLIEEYHGKDNEMCIRDRTMAVMDAHLCHLREKNVGALLADYAEDAIVITNLSKEPFIGKEQIRAYCEAATEKAAMQFGAIAGPDTRYILKDSVEELGCIGFRQKKTKQYGVLTQRVQNGKIIFESAVFKDAEVIL